MSTLEAERALRDRKRRVPRLKAVTAREGIISARAKGEPYIVDIVALKVQNLWDTACLVFTLFLPATGDFHKMLSNSYGRGCVPLRVSSDFKFRRWCKFFIYTFIQMYHPRSCYHEVGRPVPAPLKVSIVSW